MGIIRGFHTWSDSMIEEIIRILPNRLKESLKRLPPHITETIEEIRVRTERPVEIVSSQYEGFLTSLGALSSRLDEAIIVSRDESQHVLNVISNHSIYALEEELRRGYITIAGGHRIGMTGKVVLENGQVAHLREITGYNIRVAREKLGVAEPLISYIWNGIRILNTLIISPPRCGKTTILRDLTRIFSTGSMTKSMPGFKVGLIDERSEIAGCVGGIPQKNIGPRTDILDGCPKAEGMMMMIRSMSPQILVADEIGRNEDVAALLEATHAGVSIITTAHGYSLDDITRRPSFSKMLQLGIFERFIVLSKRKGAGTIEGIYDHNLRLFNGVVGSNA